MRDKVQICPWCLAHGCPWAGCNSLSLYREGTINCGLGVPLPFSGPSTCQSKPLTCSNRGRHPACHALSTSPSIYCEAFPDGGQCRIVILGFQEVVIGAPDSRIIGRFAASGFAVPQLFVITNSYVGAGENCLYQSVKGQCTAAQQDREW